MLTEIDVERLPSFNIGFEPGEEKGWPDGPCPTARAQHRPDCEEHKHRRTRRNPTFERARLVCSVEDADSTRPAVAHSGVS